MAQVQCTDGLDASSLLQEMRQQEQLSLPLPVNQRIYSGTPVTTAIPAAAAVLVNQNILVHYTVLVLECRPPASILTLTDSDERSQGIWVASLLASRSSSPCPLRTLCVCVPDRPCVSMISSSSGDVGSCYVSDTTARHTPQVTTTDIRRAKPYVTVLSYHEDTDARLRTSEYQNPN